MRTRQASPDDVDAVASMPPDTGINAITKRAIREEFDAGRMRPEWTWLAIDDNDHIIGRAVWWGRDDSAPIALDVLDVLDAEGSPTSRTHVATALLRAGHVALSARGYQAPLPHTVRLPGDWRSRPDSVDAVRWRQEAATRAGLTQVNERLQFAWTPGAETPPHPARHEFRPGADAEFQRLFAEAALGSLAVLTQRALAVSTPEDLGRAELDYYRSCPGERQWWRVAIDSAGDFIGFVIPSATPHSRNVGYLGVLPERRGHGYVDDLLAYATTFHRAAGASRITATTDASNIPMARAFERHGYRNVEVRLDLETPPR